MSRRKSDKEELINLLQELNHDLERFIRGYIESSFDVEKLDKLSSIFKPVRCREIKGCKKIECPAYENEDYRCWLQVGTLCGGEVQGEFAKKYKTCFECDVFSIISQEPVRALYENINTLIFHLKKREVKLRELAIRDQLTGIYNRHFFNDVIEREVVRAARGGEALSFIMIDLDNLKEINDTLGHLTGDRILIESANLIKDATRRSNLVFRFGGDEFLILMLNADCDKATSMVERLIDASDRWNKDNAGAYGCRLSFSIGCATCEKGGNILTTLIEADTRMYQNKMEKKNNIKERQV